MVRYTTTGLESATTAFEIRLATVKDVPRITTILVRGLPDDPTWPYLWTRCHEFPEDNFFHWSRYLKASLLHSRKCLIVASKKDEKTGDELIVAFGLWEANQVSDFVKPNQTWRDNVQAFLTCAENWLIARRHKRRDGDERRVARFFAVLDEVHKEYWEERYRSNFRLELLVTHPEHRRQGAGGMLTQWGIDRAREFKADVGVESSPMGLSLYKSLGFELLEIRTVQVENDDEDLEVRIMHYDTKKMVNGNSA